MVIAKLTACLGVGQNRSYRNHDHESNIIAPSSLEPRILIRTFACVWTSRVSIPTLEVRTAFGPVGDSCHQFCPGTKNNSIIQKRNRRALRSKSKRAPVVDAITTAVTEDGRKINHFKTANSRLSVHGMVTRYCMPGPRVRRQLYHEIVQSVPVGVRSEGVHRLHMNPYVILTIRGGRTS